MNQIIRIAMVQDNFLVGDINGNAKKIIESAKMAMQEGAQLAVFPELALVGYPPEDLLHRREFIETVSSALIKLESALDGIDVIIGAPIVRDGQLVNAAVWMRGGATIAVYAKQNLPNYSVFDEVRYFAAGDSPVVVELGGTRFGLSICEDVWIQETVSKTRQAGAEVLLVLNASPFHIGRYQERVAQLKSRATENTMPIIYVNMVGGQDELVFDGESLVLNESGDILQRCPAFASSIDYVDCESARLSPVSPSAETPLSVDESVYRCLVLGVRDFVHKNQFEGVVLGLSGGVDSALTLAIAVDALGKDNVQAVLMPSKYTAEMSNEDAVAEANALGVHYDVIPIESTIDALSASLQEVFAGTEPDTTEENMQARCRGVILMAISNKTGKMLLTTGNKSEVAVGYATLYGDMCGGFAPLKDVSKAMVYQLCRYRNSISDVIPQRVLTRPPSAELREDQCDQDSLPAYDDLDRILELTVEQDYSIDDIVEQGFEKEMVEYVVNLVKRNEYKRRQSAPGVRISRRAFGRDRRYPITSGY